MTDTTDQADGGARPDQPDDAAAIPGLTAHLTGILGERRDDLARRLGELPEAAPWLHWPIREAVVEAIHLASWDHRVAGSQLDSGIMSDDPRRVNVFGEAIEAASTIARIVTTLVAEARAEGRAEARAEMSAVIARAQS